MELRVITAVILGGASLLGGQGKIIGALLGTLFMGIIGNIMILARVSGYWQQIIFGIILIVAVAIDILLQRRADRDASRCREDKRMISPAREVNKLFYFLDIGKSSIIFNFFIP